MNLQRIIPCIALAALLAPVNMLAQSPAVHPGDRAPDIKFDKVFRSPDPYPQLEPNLSGKTTVLVFLPLVSSNKQAMMWDDVVRRYAGKPIQFVLITPEKESTLRPWLAQHSVHGWVISDLQNQAARAYGLQQPSLVYIAPDRKVLGVEKGIVPKDQTLDAALNGKFDTK